MGKRSGRMIMFKDKLKQLRIERNLTQADVANAIGVSPATVGNYEQGTREPGNSVIWQNIADYFGVSVNYLMDKNVVSRESISDYDKVVQENIILRQENEMLKKKLQSIMEIINM